MSLEIVNASDREALSGLFAGGWNPPLAVVFAVRAILDDVRERGDVALVEYTRRWDHAETDVTKLRVDIPSRKNARELIPEQIAVGLELARERIADFHARQLPVPIDYHAHDLTHYAYLSRPLGAVGAYVPGGSAPLPSTVLMTVVPAKVAGVERIVVVTPPQRDGNVDPAVLYACALTEVDELYAVGGAQAIAALAYGTETVSPVDVIVGPGNLYVQEAKRQVFGAVGIDGFAGPSDLIVIAGSDADPSPLALDLLAQAEHGPGTLVIGISESSELLAELSARLQDAPDTGAVARLVQVADVDQALALAEAFAPEHLELVGEEPQALAPRVSRAGCVFLGADSATAFGDYIAGSNHVLPTNGAARFASALSPAHFRRSFTEVRIGSGAGELARLAAPLARAEGFELHARSMEARIRDNGKHDPAR